ncbi:LysR family transcriptional regulator [Nesterenkonia muleiensis]|uniref:LysR family transcriptional regulator n=1 Tax=Nesterenkonia muleiensis TaxID=2282648 RepID=UPI001EE4ADBD|nr:LysR family transcriptional regulator [Nesterenkonia muleiensis]
MMRELKADDLLILREVARSGRFTRAAGTLDLAHTTIARRITALENALGGRVFTRAPSGLELTPLGQRAFAASEQVAAAMKAFHDGPAGDTRLEDVVRMSATDAFTTYVAAPAAAELRRRNPRLSVEIVSTTRRAGTQRSGLDIEIVVGEPRVLYAEARKIGTYVLGLYGSSSYLTEFGRPTALDQLRDHGLVYFIPSMLQVDELDVSRRSVPHMDDAVTSTNVFAHVEATRSGAGLGLLPTFLANRHDDLHRVLTDEVNVPLDYWLVTRAQARRRPAVQALIDALSDRVGLVLGA